MTSPLPRSDTFIFRILTSMALNARVVDLSTVKLTAMARRLQAAEGQQFEAGLRKKPLPDYEWRRLSLIGRSLKGGPSVLEVGPGRGYLSRMIAKGARYPRQEVVDIVAPPRSIAGKYGPGVTFRRESVADLPDPDGAFDTVLCFEVLEHLDDDTLPRALAQIRRVCARRLMVSMPFMEPLPLPAYHRQRFDPDRLQTLFPTATFTLLMKTPVTRVPWVMIEEIRS